MNQTTPKQIPIYVDLDRDDAATMSGWSMLGGFRAKDQAVQTTWIELRDEFTKGMNAARANRVARACFTHAQARFLIDQIKAYRAQPDHQAEVLLGEVQDKAQKQLDAITDWERGR